MTPEEVAAAITYANQIDVYVQLNDANTEVWWEGLKNISFEYARWAIKTYYATQNGNGEQRQPITPAAIKRIINTEVQRRESLGRALEPPRNKAPRPETFRRRNPAEWDKLFEQGRQQFWDNQPQNTH